MYWVCSLYCWCRVRLVCPMYDRLQVLQVSLYMPLLSYSVLCWCGMCCIICCMVFVVLYVICKFVRLNRLVNKTQSWKTLCVLLDCIYIYIICYVPCYFFYSFSPIILIMAEPPLFLVYKHENKNFSYYFVFKTHIFPEVHMMELQHILQQYIWAEIYIFEEIFHYCTSPAICHTF